MYSSIFSSINDRQNIANAYNSVCESDENNTVSEKKSVYDVLIDNGFNEENILIVEDKICEYTGADDCDDFIFTVPTNVNFHVENDGIGSYEFWGHEEFDRGHDYPVADDIDDIDTPDGTEAEIVSDDDEIDRMLDEKAADYGLTYEDEDGKGSYSSFEIGIKYRINVIDETKFLNWVSTIIPIESSTKNESVDDDEDEAEYDEYGEKIIRDGWKGRGANIEWRYQDVLKHVKSFNAIHDSVSNILYKLLWDMQTADGEKKSKAFDEARNELEIIRKESGKWAANKYLPGYRELMDDLARIQ